MPMLRPSAQSPPKNIQHITPIPQRNGTEQRKITKNERLTLDRTAHGQVLHHLGDGANSVVGSVIQNIQRRLGVNEQGRHVVAIAGERHETALGMGGWFYVGWIGGKCFHQFES